jgi:Ca-activated chloride channel homolog
MHLCSNPCSTFTGLVMVAALWAATPAALLAQNPAPVASAQTSQSPAPEQQKPLNVDRDPIRSPDAEETAPSVAPDSNTKAGDITRGTSGKFTLRRDVDEVILNATVLDDSGHLVNSLKQEDFSVTEDGIPQKIASFLHEDAPVSLGLVVDNSGSMLHKRSAVNTAALDVVKASNPKDETFVVNFSDEAYIDQDFTSDTAKLREGLGHIDSKGGTAMYDAVVASADQLAKYGTRPKQVLLVITDGEDNASTLTLEQTIRRIQELQGPTVYTIGLLFGDENSSRENKRAKRALQLLSNETGGIAFFPKSLSQVDDIAAEVARDIRNQYSLGYHSTKPVSQGGYRLVHVEAKAKGMGKLTVRTRTGYFPRTQKDNTAKTAPAKTQ